MREIASFFALLPKESYTSIDTIFIGGGTPSLYPLPWLKELFDSLATISPLTTCKEISMEVNPADVDEERLEHWQECGVTRLSMGVQSLDDDVLLKLNRRQRAKDVMRALRIMPKYFDNISIDLILGLPDVSTAAWQAMLDQVVTWPIKHISIYFLTIHEKTPLYFKVQRGDVNLMDDDVLVGLYEYTVAFLARHGFQQYEISNFAKPDHSSLHNRAYWDRKPYRGFGIGASSFDGQQRLTNTNNLECYIKSTMQSGLPELLSHEKLTSQQVHLELLMLSLRQKSGLDLQRVLYFLEHNKKQQFINTVASLKEAGFINQYEQVISLTVKGMALENEVITRLSQ